MVTSAMQAGLGYAADKADYKASLAAVARNNAEAKRSFNERVDAVTKAVVEEKAATDADLLDATIEGAKARATARAAAGSASVGGNSVDNIINGILVDEARYKNRAKTNFNYRKAQLEAEARNARTQAQNQVNSVVAKPKPSFLPHAISFFGNAIGAARSIQ